MREIGSVESGYGAVIVGDVALGELSHDLAETLGAS